MMAGPDLVLLVILNGDKNIKIPLPKEQTLMQYSHGGPF